MIIRKLIGTIAIMMMVAIAFLWFAGSQLTSPANASIGLPPTELHNVENVVFKNVHGWYVQTYQNQNKLCMLLMHGIRSNRREMTGRASFFEKEGYPSLVIDLQAHGENPGSEITFGYRESHSAQIAVNYLRQVKYCEKVVAVGSSLGGAAALLGDAPLQVDGYILEAVYPRIETAVRNRLSLRLGIIGEILAPLLYQQIPLRLGIELTELQPIEAISRIKSPVLILNGTKDRRTTIEEAEHLFDKAPHPKKLIKFEGAHHVNLFKYDQQKYKKAVLEFLKHYVDNRT